MNTNDDFENKRLLEEIDKLDNDPSIETGEETVKTKNPIVENFVFFSIIIIVVFAVLYLYNSKDNATKLERVDEVHDDKSNGQVVEKQTPQIAKEYTIDNENYEISTDNAKKFFETQKENIIVTQKKLNINKDLVIRLMNKNDASIPNVDVYIIYYDGENNIVGIDETFFEVLVGKTERYMTFENPPEGFERVEAFVTKKYFSDSVGMLLNNQISYKAKEDGKGNLEELEVFNNSDKKVDIIELSIIYYDSNDDILSVEKRYCFDMRNGKSEKIDLFGVWEEENGEYIDYDHYEVRLDYAIEYEK